MAWKDADMEKAAMLPRPESMQARYHGEISHKDVRAALLGGVPSLNLATGWNLDTNTLLINNTWWSWGQT